jgi:hypothetical protein
MTVAGWSLGPWPERLKELATRWTTFTAFGTFVLYLLGYLALRFHLTALGIGTDLSVLDERYLFTGARFLVYAASAIPIAILLAVVPGALLVGALRLWPRLGRWLRARVGTPRGAAIAGVVVSVAMIQLVMRRCFDLGDMLLATQVPDTTPWLAALLRDPALMPVFFAAMIAGTALPVVALVVASRAPADTEKAGAGPDWVAGLLALLVAIQLLLLPVNFGYLVVDKSLPRVAAIADRPAAPGQQAWLVWEGKDGMTYLVRHADGARTLLTIPRPDGKRVAIEIVGYDSWTSLFQTANAGGKTP